MSDYLPVPVDAARFIADNFAKQVVVIVAWDGEHQCLHTTTYGKDADDKIRAAELGPILATAAGGFVPAAKMFEDFRDAAATAVRVDEVIAARRANLVEAVNALDRAVARRVERGEYDVRTALAILHRLRIALSTIDPALDELLVPQFTEAVAAA